MKQAIGRLAHAPSIAAAKLDEIGPDDVKAIRYKLMQSRDEFAGMIGVAVSTLMAWEKGTQHPDGPALALLRVALKNPRTVAKALGH